MGHREERSKGTESGSTDSWAYEAPAENTRRRTRPWLIGGAAVGVLVAAVLVARILVDGWVAPYSPDQQRLLSHISPSIRGTCVSEVEGFTGQCTFAACITERIRADAYPGAVAGFFCDWDSADRYDHVRLTYVLFDDPKSLYLSYEGVLGVAKGDDCATDTAAEYPYFRHGKGVGRIHCYFGSPLAQIWWTDDRQLLLGGAEWRQKWRPNAPAESFNLYQWWQDLQAGRIR